MGDGAIRLTERQGKTDRFYDQLLALDTLYRCFKCCIFADYVVYQALS